MDRLSGACGVRVGILMKDGRIGVALSLLPAGGPARLPPLGLALIVTRSSPPVRGGAAIQR